MPIETTLVLIKPDAMERGLAGKIISRFEEKGLQIIGIKMLKMDEKLAEKHYAAHVGKKFYQGLVKFMCSRPIIAMAIRGVEAVDVVRTLVGATNSRKAAPGTIRGDYSNSFSSNIIHASDSLENAKKELELFFSKNEIFEHEPLLKQVLYAPDEL